MPLLGPLGILFFFGLALVGLGNWLFFTALARHDGLRRERVLFVVFDPDSPMKRPEAKADRIRLRVGAYLIGFGLVTFYTAMSTGDQRELMVCSDRCHRAGYLGGRFGLSETMGPSGRPLRACFCVGPAGSVELKQEPLPLPVGAGGPRPKPQVSPAASVELRPEPAASPASPGASP